MFLPIGDDNRDRRSTPVVNYFFILVNIFVFIFLQDWGRNVGFTYAFAAVPGEILTGRDIVTSSHLVLDPVTGQTMQIPGLSPTPIPVLLTLVTSTFLHGGIAHIAGNMLYLWIFGDNIEDALGHIRYFFFYLVCGIISGLAQVFITAYFGEGLLIPSLGASGAISGVLGAYILLFPRKRVTVWILWFIVPVPAIITVGIWFVFQLISGMGTLGGQQTGGVAYAAHIGGFIAGLLLVKLFMPARRYAEPERKSLW